MKKISGYILLGAVLILGACSDFLMEDPVNERTDQFHKDIKGLRASVTHTYKQLIGHGWYSAVQSHWFRAVTTGSDEWTTLAGANKAGFREGDQFAYSSTNSGALLAEAWSVPYRTIRQANWDIESAEKLRGEYSDEEIDAIIAESYFLRAWSYYWMVRVFKGVPIVTYTDFTEEVYNLKRNTVEEVYAQIISDLKFAEKNLPADQPGVGYIDAWAAKSFLADVYLTMAGWPLKQTAYYDSAMVKSQEVLDQGPFQLHPDYPSLFTVENEVNTEYIWQISLCSRDICGSTTSRSTFMAKATKPSELGGWRDLFPEISFFNRYPEGVRKDFVFLTEVKKRTSDVDASEGSYVDMNGDTVHYNILPWQEMQEKHPFLKKFYDKQYDANLAADDVLQSTESMSDLDMPMMRLAQVQLMYAEAQTMAQGTPNSMSIEYLNQIRRRAKGLDIYKPDASVDVTALSAEAFVDSVIAERGWELVGEFTRWFDLVRTEKVEEITALRDPAELPILNEITKDRYIAPIPASELMLNNNLEQNPGY